MTSLDYINKIFENLEKVDQQQIEAIYHDLKSAGVIIPSGEGRSKGALSIPASEMAKKVRGKIIMDRSDMGFPGKDLDEAAPILRKRHGQVCLLINSGSGKSLMPLLDAQKLASYIASSGQERDFRIDLATSDPDSPLGKLSSKYGNMVVIEGREESNSLNASKEFRTHGIMEDMFSLASGLLFHGATKALADESPASNIPKTVKKLSTEISELLDDGATSDFYEFLLDSLEQRRSCFLAGLGSSQEVARMTGVRIGHVKMAMGDRVHVAGDSNTPSPRAGDLLIALSGSGETEIVAGWCRNFKKMGGEVAAIVGSPKSTIGSVSDHSFVIQSGNEHGKPDDFYMKAAFALSPLPIYLVERVEARGLKLPEYILRWHRSVIS